MFLRTCFFAALNLVFVRQLGPSSRGVAMPPRMESTRKVVRRLTLVDCQRKRLRCFPIRSSDRMCAPRLMLVCLGRSRCCRFPDLLRSRGRLEPPGTPGSTSVIAIFRQLSQMTVSDFAGTDAFVGIQAITVYGGRRYSNLRCSHSEDRRAPDGMAVLKPV